MTPDTQYLITRWAASTLDAYNASRAWISFILYLDRDCSEEAETPELRALAVARLRSLIDQLAQNES
jgi:hypothetical protein